MIDELEKLSPCDLMVEWKASDQLATALKRMNDFFFADTRHNLRVLSIFRTIREQEALIRRKESNVASLTTSTHVTCPATGADLWIVGMFPIVSTKLLFGRAARLALLRWGGGSTVDPDTGIPSDWNHVDLGPR